MRPSRMDLANFQLALNNLFSAYQAGVTSRIVIFATNEREPTEPFHVVVCPEEEYPSFCEQIVNFAKSMLAPRATVTKPPKV